MNRKFISASKKDNNKVTINLAQFDDEVDTDGVPRSLLTTHSNIIVSVKIKHKSIDVLFKVNRIKNSMATTAATNAWPRELRLPRIGKPVTYNVVGVSYV